MDRIQREYGCFGTLRKTGGEQESGGELRNYEYERLSGTSASQFAHRQWPSLMTAIPCLRRSVSRWKCDKFFDTAFRLQRDTNLLLTNIRGSKGSSQHDHITSKQFCQFQSMVAEKDASNSTASNVGMIRRSDCEGD